MDTQYVIACEHLDNDFVEYGTVRYSFVNGCKAISELNRTTQDDEVIYYLHQITEDHNENQLWK